MIGKADEMRCDSVLGAAEVWEEERKPLAIG